MEKPIELADDDSGDNSEDRPIKIVLPGMLAPLIETEIGTRNIVS